MSNHENSLGADGSAEKIKTQLEIIEEKKREAEKEQEARFKKKFQLVVFNLEDQYFALHISEIKEVVLTPRITKVPEVPSFIKGVANIRGNIIAIADLFLRFGVERAQASAIPKYTLVLEDKLYKIGILVNDVPNTIEVTEDDLDYAGGIYTDNEGNGGIKAIVKKDDNLIILLNIQKVLDDENVNVLIERIN
ncbi:MAG: chemotaxis protein CheW [Luteibaculaceae bacterium]